MIKDLKYGWESLKLSYQANGVAALIMVFSSVYINTLYPFIQIFLLAKFIDTFGDGAVVSWQSILWIVGSFIFSTLIKMVLVSYQDSQLAYQQINTDAYVDIIIVSKLTNLDPATFEKPDFQALIAQMGGISGTLQSHLDRFTKLIDSIIKFVTATIVVSATFPLFAPLLLLASIPSFIAWQRYRSQTWPYFVEKRSLLTRLTNYIMNLVSTDSTSKEAVIFNTGPTLISKIKSEQLKYFSSFKKAVNPRTVELSIARIIQFLVFLYTQTLNINAVINKTLGIGQFTLVFQQTMNLAFSAEAILNEYSSLSVRTKYIDKFYDFLNTPCVIVPPKKWVEIPREPIPEVIEFKNVAFCYPGSERNILKDFNLVINSGEKIALVGENGAGKTTIIKLLLRFYDVTDGEILINGVNIKEIDLKKWRSQVGALFQDFIKYQFTFRENVEFGNVKIKHDEILLEEAIKKSGADNFVKELPNQVDQVLGKMFEGGMDLSGGQWQKLALARAFYRDSPMLILDEPTSAIDAKAEYEIFERVQKLQKDKTVIIISHRFSTVRNADRILVLDNGKIIEEGEHQKLMHNKGLYAELFNLQAKGYK